MLNLRILWTYHLAFYFLHIKKIIRGTTRHVKESKIVMAYLFSILK